MQCPHYKMSQIIEHTGIVNSIEGNIIRVLIIQESACNACHAKGACSASDQDEKIIEVENSDPTFKVGDGVVLYGQRSIGLQAVLLAFVIPFILILFTLLVLRPFVSSEAISGTLALSVLIPYYIILSFFKNKLKAKFQFFIRKESAD